MSSNIDKASNPFRFNMKRQGPVTYAEARSDIDPLSEFMNFMRLLGLTCDMPASMMIAKWCWKYGKVRDRNNGKEFR